MRQRKNVPNEDEKKEEKKDEKDISKLQAALEKAKNKESFAPNLSNQEFCLYALGLIIVLFVCYIIGQELNDVVQISGLADQFLVGGLTQKPQLLGQMCKYEKLIQGAEDIVIHYPSSTAFIGADHFRGSFFPPIQHFDRKEKGNGYIAAFNMTDKTFIQLKIKSKTIKSFHPHGIDLVYMGPNQIRLFVVNHRADEKDTFSSLYSVIEIFDYTIGNDYLTHIKTVQDELIWTPNDVTAVTDVDFYVSNDNYFRQGILRKLEEYLRLPLGNVIHYNTKTNKARVVASGFRSANGNNKSRNHKLFFQSNILAGRVEVYEIEDDTFDLKYITFYDIGYCGDNISVTEDGILLVAGHPRVFDSVAHFQGKIGISPSRVVSIDPSDVSGNVTIVLQTRGNIISSSTVAAVDSKTKTMLVAGFVDTKGLCICSGTNGNLNFVTQNINEKGDNEDEKIFIDPEKIVSSIHELKDGKKLDSKN